jgi:SecY interacting protein Syd
LNDVSQALTDFTRRYCKAWLQANGQGPCSEELYGVPSPCITATGEGHVFWQPQPFTPQDKLKGVEQALDIAVRDEAHAFYTTQFAGDMTARLGEHAFTLLQAWSADDFRRVQENQIGHLLIQRRLKLTPTLFIGTLRSELEVISLSNVTGEVILETLGTSRQTLLSPSLSVFLSQLEPQTP